MNKYFGQRKLVFQEQMEKKKMGRGGRWVVEDCGGEGEFVKGKKVLKHLAS